MTHYVMTYNYKPKCLQCGKDGSKYCEGVYTEEPYNGNQIVIKRSKHKVMGQYHTLVWDGETYKLNGGKFCTSSCAIAWANGTSLKPREAE